MIRNIYDRLVFKPIDWLLDTLGVYDLPGFHEYDIPLVYRVVSKWDAVKLAQAYSGYTHALTSHKEMKKAMKAMGMSSAEISAHREVIGICLARQVLGLSETEKE